VTLLVYGDFNCPFSALASARVDVVLGRLGTRVEWRAVQHDASIPAAGEPVTDEMAASLEREVATILDLSERDRRLHLVVPRVRSNTAIASAALAGAGDDTDRLRRRLFAAVWAEGRDIGDPGELRRLGAKERDVDRARQWQAEFDALPQRVTPTLVLPDGDISPGIDGLARLAELGAVAP
jgi:predicted DsbA family dithiol-disulfide isomerase